MNSRQFLFVIQVCLFLSYTPALQFLGNESTAVTVREVPDVLNFETAKNQLVVGGIDAPPVTVSHLAHLIIGVRIGSTTRLQTCTATVLYRRWLMTAAHCFPRTDEISFPDTYAFVGEARTNIRIEDSNVAPFFVDRVLVHNGFQPEQFDARNDIALVRLTRRIPRPQFTRVKLPRGRRNDPQPGEKVRAAGYGFIDNQSTRPSVLQETELEIESFATCRAATDRSLRPFLRERRQICATSPADAPDLTDTCNGDSGGPLFRVVPGESEITQFGITSFANTRECAQPDTVAYYTRVSTQRRAIRDGLRDRFDQWTVFNAQN